MAARTARTPPDPACPRTPAPARTRRRARPRTRDALALPLALAALLAPAAACDGPSDGGGTPTGAPSTGPARSPLTGDEVARDRPVLAAKIDNARDARPHSGLEAADVVHAEPVEGGLSRLLAVWSGKLPAEAGPVRSARESDLELLRQYGRPALAYSGVRSALQDALERAPLYPLPPPDAPGAYFRSGAHPAPHNLYLRPAKALAAAPRASAARDVGYRFGPAPKGGTPEERRTVRYPAARFGFDWSAERGRWLVSLDGAPARTASGERLGAATVVVQRVTVRESRYRDVAGAVTPYVETTGSGKATVLRDGAAYEAGWRRAKAGGGTEFTLPDGRRMPFARGPVWVVYVAR
ncbi:DUF3048 domain-containing protein [Streptomyces sp. Z26]|uniref:DUF3048 domain-containing protein n=1 Tax=Streptomyces sp. Z26 TaxID=2500177 RepID=UPI000EF131F8|nr:DUF3048 domain-containing protein [Streptomyces sp. Z26]RLL68216.1 DUF3048 domain-containing protein [Streptomyces sp. Z26]